MNRMTRRSLYGCRNVPNQRWGQAIVNQFKLKGPRADALFYETDEEKVKKIVEEMIYDYNLPEK